jgi:hypothetical protein
MDQLLALLDGAIAERCDYFGKTGTRHNDEGLTRCRASRITLDGHRRLVRRRPDAHGITTIQWES